MPESDKKTEKASVVLTTGDKNQINSIRDIIYRRVGKMPSESAIIREALTPGVGLHPNKILKCFTGVGEDAKKEKTDLKEEDLL